MAREADTHIRVTEETWQRLNNRKHPGDSFNDVIETMLDEDDEAESESDEDTAEEGQPDDTQGVAVAN